MTPTETASILRQFNEWRRGDEDIPQPDPREIGEAIDAAVEMIERLEAAESDALEQARLNGMGASREAALMAKLEAAEKTKSDWLRANAPGGWIDALRMECDYLLARIEAMEKQEPAGHGVLYVEAANGEEDWDSLWKHRVFAEDHVKDFVQAYSDLGESVGAITVVPLYLAPGAQPAPSVPEITIEMEHAFYEKVTVTRVGSIVGLAEGIKAAMLAVAPEVKP